MVGTFSNNDDMEYRSEIESLVVWYQDNCLSFNVRTMKEIVIDFSKQCGVHILVCINGFEKEIVEISIPRCKYQQHFDLVQPHCLRKFGTPPRLIKYRIRVHHSNCSAQNRKQLKEL